MYGFDHNKNLDILTLAVAFKTFEVAGQYDEIYLLGGWHDSAKPAFPTSARIVQMFLVASGVPVAKIFTQFDCPDTAHIRPARDTVEEADLFGWMLAAKYPGTDIRTLAFDALCVRFHKLRVSMLWGARLTGLGRVLTASSSDMFSFSQLGRILQEPIGWIISLFDPYGTSSLLGWFYERLRAGRTHVTPIEAGVPYAFEPCSCPWFLGMGQPAPSVGG